MLKAYKGVENVLADSILRWVCHDSVASNLRRLHPRVDWRELVLGTEDVYLCSGDLDASTSVDQLRTPLNGLMLRPSVLGAVFVDPN